VLKIIHLGFLTKTHAFQCESAKCNPYRPINSRAFFQSSASIGFNLPFARLVAKMISVVYSFSVERVTKGMKRKCGWCVITTSTNVMVTKETQSNLLIPFEKKLKSPSLYQMSRLKSPRISDRANQFYRDF